MVCILNRLAQTALHKRLALISACLDLQTRSLRLIEILLQQRHWLLAYWENALDISRSCWCITSLPMASQRTGDARGFHVAWHRAHIWTAFTNSSMGLAFDNTTFGAQKSDYSRCGFWDKIETAMHEQDLNGPNTTNLLLAAAIPQLLVVLHFLIWAAANFHVYHNGGLRPLGCHCPLQYHLYLSFMFPSSVDLHDLIANLASIIKTRIRRVAGRTACISGWMSGLCSSQLGKKSIDLLRIWDVAPIPVILSALEAFRLYTDRILPRLFTFLFFITYKTSRWPFIDHCLRRGSPQKCQWPVDFASFLTCNYATNQNYLWGKIPFNRRNERSVERYIIAGHCNIVTSNFV